MGEKKCKKITWKDLSSSQGIFVSNMSPCSLHCDIFYSGHVSISGTRNKEARQFPITTDPAIATRGSVEN